MMIKEEETLKNRLISSIQTCRTEMEKLCLELHLATFETQFPRWNNWRTSANHVANQNAEKLEERKAENEATCECHREKIQQLWNRLQLEAEVQRLEELKLQNIHNVTDAPFAPRSLCFGRSASSVRDQRQAFAPYFSGESDDSDSDQI
ncbi:unnamed protein product [Lampetra planeri]